MPFLWQDRDMSYMNYGQLMSSAQVKFADFIHLRLHSGASFADRKVKIRLPKFL